MQLLHSPPSSSLPFHHCARPVIVAGKSFVEPINVASFSHQRNLRTSWVPKLLKFKIAPYDQLEMIERLVDVPQLLPQ